MLRCVKTPAELTELFRARGRKVTPQRQAIFAALEANPSHPTAEAVYSVVSERMPTISRRTVYQTLNDLAEMGEIIQIDLGTGASRFDPNVDPHHHLVCESCGLVVDVAGDSTDIAVPEHELRGFEMSTTEIIFRGRCPECRATAAAPC